MIYALFTFLSSDNSNPTFAKSKDLGTPSIIIAAAIVGFFALLFFASIIFQLLYSRHKQKQAKKTKNS